MESNANETDAPQQLARNGKSWPLGPDNFDIQGRLLIDETGAMELSSRTTQGQTEGNSLVQFDDADILNPHNWPFKKKFYTFILVSFATMIVSMTSSIFSPVVPTISSNYGIPKTVGNLGVALCVLGFVTGPLIWASFSELKGRRLPFVLGMFGFTVFSFATAVSKDLQSIFICRFFTGFFGASPFILANAVCSDMLSVQAFMNSMVGFGIIVFSGPLLAPAIGGFIVMDEHLGWRWTHYIAGILGVVSFVSVLFFLDESYAPVVLVNKAKRLRYETKNWSIHAEHEEIELNINSMFQNYFTIPLKLLALDHIILCVCIFGAFVYGLLYLSITTYPIIFQQIHGMNPGVGGLPFIAVIIGQFIAGVVMYIRQRSLGRKLQANNGELVPEWLLLMAIPGSAAFAAGLLWLGWTGYRSNIHWIWPTLSGVLIGFGLITMFLPSVQYVAQVRRNRAASALAAHTILRSLAGSSFPLFATYMFTTLGVQWALTILGSIAACLFSVPVVLYIYGAKLRAKCQRAMANEAKFSHNDYTVAWICALPLEMAAAKVMLDETHDALPQPSTDHNTYTLGQRAGHNVVVACLPSGVYGTTSAATVLSHMLPTFPRLRFGLMVGIGGGVPQKDVDIRLGDVVVSLPSETSGGVIQYDFGKTIRDGQFQRTGSLNKPPQFLLTAISQMRSDQVIGKRPITEILLDILRSHQEMKEHFLRPANDWLFEPTYTHERSPDCSQCDQTKLIQRPPRQSEDPHVHYGLIASGNQVIKDAARRDALAREMDILCFEMEAAGLMDQLPCLVIRGICDYCDSHKNKDWQGYAALAAAAYAKAFLELIPIHGKNPEPRPPRTAHHWMVPFHRNSRFVGREEEINRIERMINTSPSKIAVCGLGGVGKTQIALEIAHRMRERDFDSIFWIPCTSHESVEQAYMSMAQMLGIQETKTGEAKSRVKAHLSQQRSGKWLLIFDNADDMSMWSRGTRPESTPLSDYLPQHEQGHILFTTRNRKVAVLLASTNVIHVAEPDPKAAMRMMQRSLVDKDLLNDSNQAIALQLLENLAFLPLAISQAAAYINENSINLSDYMELLQDQEAEVIDLLSEDFGDDWRYQDIQNPVATTWLISFQQVQQLNQLAAEYLLFMACIDHRNIPKSLLPEAASKKRTIDAIGLLKAFSFLSEQAGSLNLHRLVHLSTRNWLRTQGHFDGQIATTAIRCDQVFPDHTWTNRKTWREYLPHVLALIREVGFQEEYHLGLVRRVGKCLSVDGRNIEALPLFERILDSQRQLHGDDDLEATVVAMNDLAHQYCRLARWSDAEEMQLQVLEIRKQELGPDHSDTLSIMNNLALTYSGCGKLKEAEELRTQLYHLDRRMRGREHWTTLGSAHNLASVYRKLGKLEQAERLALQAFEARKRTLEADHPDISYSMGLLARIYQDQGRWQEAEQLQVPLLEIYERVNGLQYSEALSTMHNLAQSWQHLGRTDDAISMLETCLNISLKVWDPGHPDTIATLDCLRAAIEERDNADLSSSS
ncbi:uncharacterized protein DSM5745_02022 [Aspergillus mulundensis]|uniref:Major facilitator superfamily (MFS) profile domain-containing protein n=1 Tax=Aspergillus mulundensis TaxID=1810919 RepID=A0A3D8SVA2_9EURO|nr:hypothetical protein DSM5745_02022 [Aspergillus mulundensis]RDW90247.1 hypothetical protein DSM5745_02022 [Aspergillus mulundensis]